MNESHHRLALPQGTRIQDFEFHRVLGQGGFGITYLGWNMALNIPVAIKEYLPYGLAIRDRDMSVVPQSSQVASDFAWGLDDFLEEARRLAQFNHPNIVRVHHFFEAHSTAYIVMEYAEGETLSSFLQSRETLSEDELKAILYPLLEGLEEVHRVDYLHRDIKPGNIIIRDEDHSPVLIDFGAARQVVGIRSQSIDAIISPPYSPIEQYSSRGEQGPGTDIYALGALCYRALTGEGPDEAPERVAHDPLIPVSDRCAGQASKKFLSAIDWALQVHKGDRPQSIAEWRAALQPPLPPPPPPPPPELTKAVSRLNRWFLWFWIGPLAFLLPFLADILGTRYVPIYIAVVLLTYLFFTFLCGGGILHTLWHLIPAEEAKTTPGKAIGFLFVPFFNLYWNFITFYSFAEALNNQTRHREIKNKKISKWLCLGFCIFSTLNLLIFHLIVLLIVLVESFILDDAPIQALMIFFLFFTGPINAVLGIMVFRQMKNTGIALLNGDGQEDIEKRKKKSKGKVLWSILCVCLLLAGLGGYVWWENKKRVQYMAKFEKALENENFSIASRYIDSLRAVNPDVSVLPELERRLSAAYRRAVGGIFKDCEECPQMVGVLSGSFTMGSPSDEGSDDEGPQHVVHIGYRFAVGVYEVTFAEWDACVDAGGCRGYVPDDEGWGRGNRPVVNVSWDDAQSYVRWLSSKTGHRYSLLSESEWEYVARAGTTTPFYFGSTISTDEANYDGNYTYGTGRKGVDREKTVAVGSFSANAWGVYDMHGNVWEWVEDCYNDSYVGAPTDGSAWESGDCGVRVVRGGSWINDPWFLRSASRDRSTTVNQFLSYYGFRVLRRF